MVSDLFVEPDWVPVLDSLSTWLRRVWEEGGVGGGRDPLW